RPAYPHCRGIQAVTLAGARDQSFYLRELVFEYCPRPRVAIRCIECSDEHTVDGCLDVAALRIDGITRKCRARDNRLTAARKNSDAVPRFLSSPDAALACPFDGGLGAFRVRCLQLLQADHVRLRILKPRNEVVKTLVDIVDVEGGDLHPEDGIAIQGSPDQA